MEGRTGIFNNTPAPDREGIFNNTPAWNKIDVSGVPISVEGPNLQCGGLSNRLMVADGRLSPEITPHKNSHQSGDMVGNNGWKRGKLADTEIEELREEYERHQKENEVNLNHYGSGVVVGGGVSSKSLNSVQSNNSPTQQPPPPYRSSNSNIDQKNAKNASSTSIFGSIFGGLTRWIPGPSEPIEKKSLNNHGETQMPSRKRRRVQLSVVKTIFLILKYIYKILE